MRELPFVQVDVFTQNRLEGNQLAVFLDGRGLSTEQMQSVAREMNFSETTFILPRDEEEERQSGHQVRIFTTTEELPFAGHPTLGTAMVLRGNGGAEEIWLDLKVGKIPVTFEVDSHGLVFGEMSQRDPDFGMIHNLAAVADAIGAKSSDLDPSFPIQTVSTGMPFVIVPFRSLKTLQSLKMTWQVASNYLQATDGKFFYLICRETANPKAHIHSRMIFYGGEDPATGSAAGCAASWMAKYEMAPSGERVMIEQGLEIQRPSEVFVRAEKHGDRVMNVKVGGHAVEIGRGQLNV